MYIEHFGLEILPFENVPDPIFFFDRGDYFKIRQRVNDSLLVGRGLIIVTGPVGSGKTTLCHMITSKFPKNFKIIWIAEPPKNSLDLFLFIAEELGVRPGTSEKVFFLRDIRRALLDIISAGNRCLLMIDESHLLKEDTLHGILLLNNLEEGSKKLMQILLLGQEEIINTINRPEMKAFKQRISALENIGKMNAERMRNYILYRIQVAGGQPSLFTEKAWDAIILASGTGGGIPRIINTVCEKSLTIAYENQKTAVDLDDVSSAAEELGIDREVFHYKIALKNKERIEFNESASDLNATNNPEADDAVKRHPYGSPDLRVLQQNRRDAGTSSRNIKRAETGGVRLESNQSAIKGPLVFLSFSIITLFLSMYIYCDERGFSDSMTCLQGLIGF